MENYSESHRDHATVIMLALHKYNRTKDQSKECPKMMGKGQDRESVNFLCKQLALLLRSQLHKIENGNKLF